MVWLLTENVPPSKLEKYLTIHVFGILRQSVSHIRWAELRKYNNLHQYATLSIHDRVSKCYVGFQTLLTCKPNLLKHLSSIAAFLGLLKESNVLAR